ncbi:MAG: hypothetical protein GZ088_16030 [Acidipila sp.]|nr:hypothetical protein [Acidipila sp.]
MEDADEDEEKDDDADGEDDDDEENEDKPKGTIGMSDDAVFLPCIIVSDSMKAVRVKVSDPTDTMRMEILPRRR